MGNYYPHLGGKTISLPHPIYHHLYPPLHSMLSSVVPECITLTLSMPRSEEIGFDSEPNWFDVKRGWSYGVNRHSTLNTMAVAGVKVSSMLVMGCWCLGDGNEAELVMI